MKVFKQFNTTTDEPCPICGTKDEKEVVLIAIDDEVEGHNARALQVHLDCIELWYNKEFNLIYQRLGYANDQA
jgi:hypothetical protein